MIVKNRALDGCAVRDGLENRRGLRKGAPGAAAMSAGKRSGISPFIALSPVSVAKGRFQGTGEWVRQRVKGPRPGAHHPFGKPATESEPIHDRCDKLAQVAQTVAVNLQFPRES